MFAVAHKGLLGLEEGSWIPLYLLALGQTYWKDDSKILQCLNYRGFSPRKEVRAALYRVT